MKTIQELAKECLSYLETKKRDNGDEFICQTDKSPEWFADLVREAHDELLPDNYIYQWVQDSLSILSEAPADCEDLEETGREQIEPDIYTTNLLLWLSSNLYRVEEVNDALRDSYSKDRDLVSYISEAQANEKERVFITILNGLIPRQ